MTTKSKLNEELEASARSLAKRASEIEEQWRGPRGLTKRMNQKSNARAMKRRRRASNPKEPKGAAKFRRYRDRKLGKIGAASKVRHIDPATAEVV